MIFPFVRIILFVGALLMLTVDARAESEIEAPSLVEDLLAALTLQGMRCEDVVDVDQEGESDYEVECRTGGRYRINLSPEGALNILRIARKVTRAGVDVVTKAATASIRILGLDPDASVHDAEVARHLYAMVTLAGHHCDEVVGLERRNSDDHVITCRNGLSHRVYTAPDGLVVVETQ